MQSNQKYEEIKIFCIICSNCIVFRRRQKIFIFSIRFGYLVWLFKKKVLQEKMFNALIEDNVDFVKLFLEYGVNLQKFLTFKRLQDLYNTVSRPKLSDGRLG